MRKIRYFFYCLEISLLIFIGILVFSFFERAAQKNEQAFQKDRRLGLITNLQVNLNNQFDLHQQVLNFGFSSLPEKNLKKNQENFKRSYKELAKLSSFSTERGQGTLDQEFLEFSTLLKKEFFLLKNKRKKEVARTSHLIVRSYERLMQRLIKMMEGPMITQSKFFRQAEIFEKKSLIIGLIFALFILGLNFLVFTRLRRAYFAEVATKAEKPGK